MTCAVQGEGCAGQLLLLAAGVMHSGPGGSAPPLTLRLDQVYSLAASWHPPLRLSATPPCLYPQPEVLLSPKGDTGTSLGSHGLGSGSTAVGGAETGAAGELESPLPGMPLRV